jgi:xanthine dehydrogenase YagS FAD-binding subunit
MRKFSHINASTIDEAVLRLRRYGGKASVVAGGTEYVKPYRAIKAEEALIGRGIDESTAEAAADAAVSDAKPLPYNNYMVQIARTMVKRAILACT